MIGLGIAVDITEVICPRTLEIITNRGMGNPYSTVFVFHSIYDANQRIYTNATNKCYHSIAPGI